MSLTVDGFWKAGFWNSTFWADGFWYEPAPVVVTSFSTGGGKGRHGKGRGRSQPRHIRWEDSPKRPLTNREEVELVRLVKRAITEDDQKARVKLEALAKNYREFENSLKSFSEAFQALSLTNRNLYADKRISAIRYNQTKQDIEEEEQVILHLLNFIK